MNIHILNYLAEANIGLILFLLAYWLFFIKETNFSFKRTYLLIGMLASLVFPLMKINMSYDSEAVNTPYVLLHMVIGPEQGMVTQDNPYTWDMVLGVYAFIAILLLLRLAYQSGKLLKYLKSSPSYLLHEQYKVYESAEAIPSFSFFKYIIIGNATGLSECDKDQVVRHEIAHAQKMHSIDVLLAESLCILFWFNPATRIIKNIISDVHEFQADETAVKDRDAQAYCSLLARISLQSAGFSLVNHFNNSLTLKRIAMIKSTKKKTGKWKMTLVIPVVAVFFFFAACQDEVMNEISDVAQSTTMALDLPAQVETRLNELKRNKPEAKFVVSEIMDTEGTEKLNALVNKYGGHDKISSIEIIKLNKTGTGEGNRGFIIMEFNETISRLAESSVSHQDVFTVVEESAHPENGQEEFYNTIHANLKYPEKARSHGVTGKVLVEFIVEKDGALSNLKVLKGIGYGCDEEALRVLSLVPSWEPGKQNGAAIRQKMVLPFLFQNNSPESPAKASQLN